MLARHEAVTQHDLLHLRLLGIPIGQQGRKLAEVFGAENTRRKDAQAGSRSRGIIT